MVRKGKKSISHSDIDELKTIELRAREGLVSFVKARFGAEGMSKTLEKYARNYYEAAQAYDVALAEWMKANKPKKEGDGK